MMDIVPSQRRRFIERLWRWLAGQPASLILAGLFMATLTAASLLPQLPLHVAADVPERTRWLATTSFAYGGWGTFLRDLGLFDVAHTIWWRTLLTLVLFHGLLRLAEVTERAWRLVIPRTASLPSYRQAAHLSHGDVGEMLAQLWQHLSDQGYSRRSESKEGDAILWRAVHHRWSAWGTVLAWLGIILLLVWALLGEKGTWRVADLPLPPNETVSLSRSGGLSLQLPMEANSSPETVIFLKDDAEVARRHLSYGRSASYDGVSVHWLGMGPALLVKGQDASGTPVDFQPLSDDGSATHRLHLLFDSGDEHTFGVPAVGLGFRVIADADNTYTVEVYRSGEGFTFLQEQITGEGSLTIEGTRYTFSPVSFVRVNVEHSPFFLLLLIGGFLAVVGVSLPLWLPTRALWLRTTQSGQAAWVEWTAEGESTDGWLRQELGVEAEDG